MILVPLAAWAQSHSTAKQTLMISVETPSRMSIDRPALALTMAAERGRVVARAADRLSFRHRVAGGKISASVASTLPDNSRLVLHVGSSAHRFELNVASRSVDLVTDIRSDRAGERTIAYTLVGPTVPNVVTDRTPSVVYTLTD